MMEKLVNKIWKDYHDQLYAFIFSKVKDQSTSEDILQDVFVKTLEKIDKLKDSEKLKSWLYTITRNAISDHFRKIQKENFIIENFKNDEETKLSAMKQAEGWIKLYIDVLPENYKVAIQLYELEGKSIDEIAKHQNISYTNAKARVQRGRKALKKKLTDCCTFNVDAYGNLIDYHKNPENCPKNCN